MYKKSLTKLFLNTEEVAQNLGISKSYAYTVVRQLNEDFESKGFIKISGRISAKYLEERFYGLEQKNA